MGCGHKPAPEPLTPSEQRLAAMGQYPPTPQPEDAQRPEPTQMPPRKRAKKGERFANWLARIITFSDPRYKGWFPRTQTLLVWVVVAVFYKVPSFLHVVLGPRVSPEVLEERNGQCDTCIRCVKLIEMRRGVPVLCRFCGSCACGQWFIRVFGRILATSELSFKNRFRNHDCPANIHVGSQLWRDAIEETSDEDLEDDDPEMVEDGLADADIGDTAGGSGVTVLVGIGSDGGPGEVLAGVEPHTGG